METALVYDNLGNPLYWHMPKDRGPAILPDSRTLWEVLWEHRGVLGGVAHTHPWNGAASPSHTDVTTFAAIEDGLWQRLTWGIVTFTEIRFFVWAGGPAGRHDYIELTPRHFRIPRGDIARLRELSR